MIFLFAGYIGSSLIVVLVIDRFLDSCVYCFDQSGRNLVFWLRIGS